MLNIISDVIRDVIDKQVYVWRTEQAMKRLLLQHILNNILIHIFL